MVPKLGRKKPHRDHLIRNLVTSLILYERLTTTSAKAKAIKPVIDRLITTAKKDNLSARRTIIGFVFDDNAAKKLIDEIVPRYTDRTSGYTRLYHLSPRLGDAAPMAVIEFMPAIAPLKKESETAKTEKKEPKSPAKKPTTKKS